MKAPGLAATELPWLVPGAAALVALTRPLPLSAWSELRLDPGAVLMLARVQGGLAKPSTLTELTSVPETLDFACFFLHQHGRERFVDWNRPGPDMIYHACLEQASLARALAEKIESCDSERAWVAGLLAPLGWLALCAIEPASLVSFLQDFARSRHQPDWQRHVWGLDHTSIVRRLCSNWGLPGWLSTIIGNLALPVDIAQRLGADPVLFQVVQLAIALCQRNDPGLALPLGSKIPDLLRGLDIETCEMEQAIESANLRLAHAPREWKPATQNPLLIDLLRATLDNRKLHACTPIEALQRQVDELHGVLEERCVQETERLQARKMSALAEMAAGAGHEINNPLAVVSAQAQYVLRQLEEAQSLVVEEPALAPVVDTLQAKLTHSLKAIVGQSQRIHQVLTDLMQFARPGTPRPQPVRVQSLLAEVVESLASLCENRKVRLVCLQPTPEWHVRVDPNQLRTALVCLVRNAIEAAPPEGWAGLRVEKADEGTLQVIVEDNGPGPSQVAREHLFDPFYSGRSAGRGRGMGLPTAWRLARQQGGDVSFEGHASGVTRFILTLPNLEMKPTETLHYTTRSA